MTRPKRIQRKRAKGWKMPPNTVSVCRPSLFGNPFIHDDPAKAVEAYEQFLQGGTQCFEMGPGKLQFAKTIHRDSLHWDFATKVKASLPQLRGKNLACWCSPDQPCHADVLLKLANPEVKT